MLRRITRGILRNTTCPTSFGELKLANRRGRQAWRVHFVALMNRNNDRIKLGVLWKNVSRDGSKKYLSGTVRNDGLDAAWALLREGGRLLVLSNTSKREGKKDPDCELFVIPASAAPARADDKKR